MGKILGISCEHDSGVCILDESGVVLASVNEERFAREKLFTGVPEKSLDYILSDAGVSAEEIDSVAVASKMHVNINDWVWDEFSLKRDSVAAVLKLPLGKTALSQAWILSFLAEIGKSGSFRNQLKTFLGTRGIKCPVDFLDHHLCHNSSAIHTSGFEEGLSISFDAQGDGFSSKVYTFSEHGRKKKVVFQNPFFKSPAHYYGYVTKLLGFRQMEHEGKVTGLSAYGNPDKTYHIFEERLYFDENKGRFISKGGYIRNELKHLEKKFQGISKEDIAAGVQKHLEVNMVKFVRHLLRKHPCARIALSGGIFANVLLNQKISEIDGVESIHVHPNMGDGGLAFGAAAELASRKDDYKNIRIDNVFWGPSPTGDLDSLKNQYKLSEIECEDVCQKTAEFLAQKKVVALVEGGMEYGPRALCHRSIIYNPFDTTVNDWLNKKLERTEFMPFAPVVLDEDIDANFDNIASKKFAMEFMTVTCHTKTVFQEKAPATNHIDNTARPQIAFARTGRIYEILKSFKALTECPVLINTSFNMHGEPIVNTCEDAVKSFLASRLDYLLVNGRLFKSENNP
jgi:carbamoyltransferase